MVVARPRRADVVPLGSFPGWHEATLDGNDVRVEGVAGRKALGLMRDVVRTYTLPGALVADATAGSGTTAIACQLEGRRCVASEVRPATFEKAQLRIAHGNSALRSPNQTRMEF